VRGRAVARREALAGYDESGGVGTPVEEELDQHVNSELGVVRDLLEGEAPDGEKNCENCEASELERLAADCVDGGNGEPVTWDRASADKNAVTCCEVVQALVYGLSATVANGAKDSSGVQTKTVESNLNTSEHLSVGA
jgi:hypothetical protein